jgi:hypothetical protein
MIIFCFIGASDMFTDNKNKPKFLNRSNLTKRLKENTSKLKRFKKRLDQFGNRSTVILRKRPKSDLANKIIDDIIAASKTKTKIIKPVKSKNSYHILTQSDTNIVPMENKAVTDAINDNELITPVNDIKKHGLNKPDVGYNDRDVLKAMYSNRPDEIQTQK